MKLELDFMSSLCCTGTFFINGVRADSMDFGDSSDDAPDTAEEYGCGDRRFHPRGSTPEVLHKYKISVPEYNIVAGQLAAGLSFGSCGWCV